MINTIFYYPESLAYDDYTNMLNNGDISGRTIVFAKEQGKIYMGGKEYTKDTLKGGFPDGDYDPQHFSGFGRKTISLKEDSNNIITQSDFDKEHTIYQIGHDFDLDGATIEIPADSILEFDGGSIKNGILVGDNTYISAEAVKIFDEDVELQGTWKTIEAYTEWFGAKADGVTNDTTAFYKALDTFDNIVLLEGTYLIDWVYKVINNKTIVGKNRVLSKIKQRNTNTPFAAVESNTIIKNLTFEVKHFETVDEFTPANTEITDILSFGYSYRAGDTYHHFDGIEILSVNFNGDSNTIPIHFNLQYAGDGGGVIKDIKIVTCYTGLYYQFNRNITKYGFGWITEHLVSNVNVVNPTAYGFKWGAISMYGEGTSAGEGNLIRTMWCYANRFENIQVELHRHNSTGFYIGLGMGTLVNPIVFNDIPKGPAGAEESHVGYAAEFAPIGSPRQYKMFTRVIGGSLEGNIKNPEYIYMNIMDHVSFNIRNNFNSSNNLIVYNSDTIPQPIDLNIYGTNFYSHARFINVIPECGTDNFGQYIKIRRSNPDIHYLYGINCTLSKEYLRSLNLPAGKYTIQTIAESNKGGRASGTIVTVTGYNYEIDGVNHEAVVWRGSKIINSYFIELPDSENIENDITIFFGELSRDNEDAIEWIKIYDVQFLNTLVGNYKLTLPSKHVSEIIGRSKEFEFEGPDDLTRVLRIDHYFKSLEEWCTATQMPISINVRGRLPHMAVGETLSVGQLDEYKANTRNTIPLVSKDSGTLLGRCFITWDGITTITALTEIADNTEIIGSYAIAGSTIDPIMGTDGHDYISRFPKVISANGMPINEVGLTDRDVYGGLHTDAKHLSFNTFHSSRFGLAMINQGNLGVKLDTSYIPLQKAMTKLELADNVLLKNYVAFESGQQVFITDEGSNGTLCNLLYDKSAITTWVQFEDYNNLTFDEDDVMEIYFFGRRLDIEVNAGDTPLEVIQKIRTKAIESFDVEFVDDITTPISGQEGDWKWEVGQINITDTNPSSSVIYVKYVNRLGIFNYSGGAYVIKSKNNAKFVVQTRLDSGYDFKVVTASGDLVTKFWT